MSEPAESFELVLRREIDVPREKLWRCWTEADLLPHWFCPKPWGVARARLDLRPGGDCHVTMLSPEGEEFPNPGVYLEVVPNERLVFTDAFTTAWEPSAKPFMTGVITFEDLGNGRTAYIATAKHWTAADRDEHEKMGFHEGWGKATDQLAELAATL
jgi:uncharacterized protein YndB with AHSA1/START domain